MIRRTLIILAVCAPLTFGGCQCSDKPDIGPVEDEESHLLTPDSPSTPGLPLYG